MGLAAFTPSGDELIICPPFSGLLPATALSLDKAWQGPGILGMPGSNIQDTQGHGGFLLPPPVEQLWPGQTANFFNGV